MKKRFLSILLTAVLLCAVPLVLVDTAYADIGTCGDNVTWKLTSDGTLTISGKGGMPTAIIGIPAPIISGPLSLRTA